MKKLLLILAFTITTTSLAAQDYHWKGFSFGVDRDSLLFLIASPFDNWYVNFSGGVQTFNGNTPDPAAQWNSLNLGARVEVGKWILPDLAFSLRFGAFHTNSKSRHAGNNPWVDLDHPINYANAQNGPYYPISVHGLSAIGIITFDWTNFLSGFEAGRRKHWHIYTPIGMGGIWLYGNAIDQNYINKSKTNGIDVELGDIIWNKELAFTGGVQVEYIASPTISFNVVAELLGARGSLDDYNYRVDDDQRRADLIPSIYAGVKLNLLKEVKKYNPNTKASHIEKVNHKFLTIGTRGDIERNEAELERLNHEQDSLVNLIVANNGHRDDLIHKYDSLADILDALNKEIEQTRQPVNVIEELLAFNEKQGLPAVTVYFQLDRYEIDYNGHKRLQNFAIEANQLDDSLVFYVIGAADSATGSIPHNVWLSERRCEVVYNALVNDYGVKAARLITTPVGGITDYEPKENNRMGMVMLRTPETEEIVERWQRRMKEQ